MLSQNVHLMTEVYLQGLLTQLLNYLKPNTNII